MSAAHWPRWLLRPGDLHCSISDALACPTCAAQLLCLPIIQLAHQMTDTRSKLLTVRNPVGRADVGDQHGTVAGMPVSGPPVVYNRPDNGIDLVVRRIDLKFDHPSAFHAAVAENVPVVLNRHDGNAAEAGDKPEYVDHMVDQLGAHVCLDFHHESISFKGETSTSVRGSANQRYTAGRTSSVSNVDVIRPPTTTAASGRCTFEPIPSASNSGTRPRIATEAVIRTGRRRRSAPTRTASSISRPRARSSLMYETITTPLSTATPNTAMKPTAPGTDRYSPEIQSAKMPPVIANGTFRKISAA